MISAGVWHSMAPAAQPSCRHVDDALHWLMICDRMDRGSLGRGAPTKDMSQGRSELSILRCQSRTSASVRGWK
jgi:hypothetical protein